MIVDFTVENFRSIKEQQTLSMYAESKPMHHAGNITNIEPEIGVLKTCAIYGANASGKTNIILAIDALSDLVSLSGDLKDGDKINQYEPYLLSESSKGKSTKFEIEFYIKSVRHYYYVEFNSESIIYEKLDHYPNKRVSNVFTRSSPDDWKSVTFGEHYKGGKKKIPFFKNNSYLSKAGNNPETPELIRDVYNFFRLGIFTKLIGQNIGVNSWSEDANVIEIINNFLQNIDLGIKGFDIRDSDSVSAVKFPSDIPEELKKKVINELSKKEIFLHENENGETVEFDKSLESSGTQKIFKMLPFLITVLKRGYVTFIDEIESSFHPHVAELIVKLFNDPLVNKNNAQLIFTTHDLMLMSSRTMRKDQIYLTQKSKTSGTSLVCLDSYDSSLKESSPFAKWYDEGRLGGIPSINYKNIAEKIREGF